MKDGGEEEGGGYVVRGFWVRDTLILLDEGRGSKEIVEGSPI